MDDIQLEEIIQYIVIGIVIFLLWQYWFKPVYTKGYVYDNKVVQNDVQNTPQIGDTVASLHQQALGMNKEEIVARLKLKSNDAVYYDSSYSIYVLAYVIQMYLEGNLIHFSAFNDKFHNKLSYANKHTTGEAFDFTVVDEDLARLSLKEILSEFSNKFIIKDGYENQFGTGQHFHVESKSKESKSKESKSKETTDDCSFNDIDSFIKCNEGYRQTVYEDTKGNRTVCYGHNLEAFPLEYTKYTREICEEVFNDDVKYFRDILDRSYSWWNLHPEAIQAVVLDLIFNLGERNFAKFNTTLGFIKKREYTEAGAALLQNSKLCTNNEGNTTNRCKRQVVLLKKGEF